jgi:DHA2 family multidrug resistance protein
MATAAAVAGSAPETAITPLNRALLTVAVMGASVIQILDSTIANVALPHMQTSLGASLDTVTWVLTSYIIASAIAMPITGWLADRIGGRQLFLISVGGFVIASMLCGLATNLEEMVAFRVMQGISGAFIAPLAQTVMLDINPPERHARAMAIWGMGIMVGPIMGPIIGGWLTENYSWRWCFYVNVPIGIATIAALWALLPHKPVFRRKFDHLGFWALAVGLGSLQLMLDRGAQLDWFDSWEIRIEAAIATAAFWVFAVQMATSKNALFAKKMLTNRSFATSLFFMIVIGVVMFANMALLPPMMQNLYGYPVIDTGLLLAPRGVGILLSMAVAGRLVGKVDARILVGTGFSIAAFSMWQMSQWSMEMDWRPFAISGLVQGLGMGLVFIPLNTLAFASLPATMHRWRKPAQSVPQRRRVGRHIDRVYPAGQEYPDQPQRPRFPYHRIDDQQYRCEHRRPLPGPGRSGTDDGRRAGQQTGGDDRLSRRLLGDDVGHDRRDPAGVPVAETQAGSTGRPADGVTSPSANVSGPIIPRSARH